MNDREMQDALEILLRGLGQEGRSRLGAISGLDKIKSIRTFWEAGIL